MVQFFHVGPSRSALMKEELGKSLGQGLSNFMGNYIANKDLEGVMNDPTFKNAPLSERQSRLQMAMQPHGERGEKILQSRFQIEQQKQQEGIFQKAQKVAKDPKSTSSDILFALMEAGAGVPGSERYIGPAYQALMNQRGAELAPNVPGITGKGQTPETTPRPKMPGFLEGQMPQQTAPQEQTRADIPTAKDLGEQPMKLSNAIPYDLGDLVSPEQQAEILRNVRLQGGDVDFTKSLIQDYNQGKIGQTDLLNANVDRAHTQALRQQQQEQTAKNFINTQVPNDASEAEKNLYYNMFKKELPKFGDMTSAWQKVSKDVANVRKTKDRLIANMPQADILGFSDAGEKMMRSAGKSLMDIDPLAYNILEEAYTQKGHPITEPARIHNPLPPDIKNITGKAGDYKPYIYPGRDVSDQEMLRSIDDAQKDQSAESPKVAENLSKGWNDNISLINIYVDLKKKAWFPEQIFQVFDDLESKLSESGNKFSVQQEKERAQLLQAPQIPVNVLLK